MRNAVNWFEIPADNFDRAVGFYDAILHRPLKREIFMGVPNALFPFEGDGVGGAVVKMDGIRPSPAGTTVYINVEGYLDDVVLKAPVAGGKVVMEKTAIGPAGYIAVIEDTEGNRVGLHSQKP
jgi:hypothetical protein